MADIVARSGGGVARAMNIDALSNIRCRRQVFEADVYPSFETCAAARACDDRAIADNESIFPVGARVRGQCSEEHRSVLQGRCSEASVLRKQGQKLLIEVIEPN